MKNKAADKVGFYHVNINLEDTICGGAITDILLESGQFTSDEDSSVAAKFIYRSAKENIFAYFMKSTLRRKNH